ncbi:MAG: tetratricopeptide repeat protein, partial [Bacteroidia bacterium]
YIGEAYYARGNSKFNKKDKEGSCADWNKANELGVKLAKQMIISYCTFTPKTAEDFYMRAQTKRRKEYKEAIDDYTQAIQLNPKYAEAYYYRGYCKLGAKDKEGACADWKKANELKGGYAKDEIDKYCK